MAAEAPEIRVTDSKARVTLPRSFANSTLLLEVRGDNEIVLRKAKVVPLAEDESGPVPIKFSAADWQKFLEILDTPPEPNDELKALMRKPWADGKSFEVEE